MVQSAKVLASSIFGVPFMIPVASISHPTPSAGTIISMGAPFALDLAPLNAKDTPIGISPEAACLHGLEPE